MILTKLNEVCTCCGGSEFQPILQLFDDKCFKIVDGKSTTGQFCLADFAFPADGYHCINTNIDIDGGEYLLFDNQVDLISPSGQLESGKLYARGILIKITYPVNDDNGEEILISDKNVTIALENAETLVESQFPLHNLFIMFTNPKSNQTETLINKIKIINPNLGYKVRLSALVILGQAI
jgi:hypothetical protein